MSLGAAGTVALEGLIPHRVRVEAHVGQGLPGFTVLGISGGVGAQAGQRVRAALAASGHNVGQRKVLVNLAPAEVHKRGARFDLPIAVAVLRALGVLPAAGRGLADGGLTDRDPAGEVVLGELALTGSVLPVPGVLPSLRGLAAATVPRDNAAEAALAGIDRVMAVADLAQLVAVATGEAPPPVVADPRVDVGRAAPDLADVAGQLEARRALEVAAAGGHHLLLLGPPGSGKSMLARRLPGLLPPLDDEAALTVAAIASVAGRFRPTGGLDRRPPFADPHHTASGAALLGGGSGLARPGAVSLAAHGVLFLDELLEWSGRTLDGLRQPMEEGMVRLARSQGTVTYPASFLLVAASNPCPCGPAKRGCRCRPDRIERYRARLTGPLADRIDLAPLIEPVPAAALASGEAGESTAAVAGRVLAARERAARRGPWVNAAAPIQMIRATARPQAVDVLVRAVRAGRLSARGFDRALRVARTCADLAGSACVEVGDAREAVAHRARLDQMWEAAA